MMHKKSMIQIQFSWIFIIIAGTIILLFFVSLVKTQKENSDISMSVKVLTNLDAIITGSRVSTSTSHLIDMPNLDVELDCHTFRMGKIEKQLDSFSVFGPRHLVGNKLITYSKDWNVPFRVTNFLYITTREVRYIIAYINTSETDEAEILYGELPDAISKELIDVNDLSSLTNKNNYNIRFICFNNECTGQTFPTFLEDFETSLVNIDIDNTASDSDFGYGKIDFYDYQSGSFVLYGTTSYIRDASLYGAIYSGSKEQYDCVMQKSFDRLTHVSDVYYRRTIALLDSFTNICNVYYESAKGLFGTLRYTQTFSDDNVLKADGAAKGLASSNELAQLYSCPVLY